MTKFDIVKNFLIILTILVATIGLSILSISTSQEIVAQNNKSFWEFRSIDTMKISRDESREHLENESFDQTIDTYIADIAGTGATHVAIGTPYDEEFIPILARWVKSAREHNLKVWFRGNFAGWEGWFEYDRIDRAAHQKKLEAFILSNPDLFEDGDVFSACPECENGGPGDPRQNGDVAGHRKFLIDEYRITQNAFRKIGKNVTSNYNSMNGDVARLVMDRKTTEALGGIVVVDHYVESPEQLSKDITGFAQSSGGKVILGEIGAPIPDIHGEFSEDEQKEWLEDTIQLLSQNENLAGLNYWVNVGGSTELWTEEGEAKSGVEVLKTAFSPYIVEGKVVDVDGDIIKDATLISNNTVIQGVQDGVFEFPSLHQDPEILVQADDYLPEKFTLSANSDNVIILHDRNPSLFDRIKRFIKEKFEVTLRKS